MNFSSSDFPDRVKRRLTASMVSKQEDTASIVKRRGSSTSQGKRPSEAGVQNSFVNTARGEGYMHLRTSRVRRPCSGCGKVDHRGDGCSLGLPDLIQPAASYRHLWRVDRRVYFHAALAGVL